MLIQLNIPYKSISKINNLKINKINNNRVLKTYKIWLNS